ncbi:RNA-directed DNA polymerase, eukaryota, reverse transcriptase zinc-binding domain protein [Tanacetum coccineum]
MFTVLAQHYELKVAAWNVGGMCNKAKQKEVKRFIRQENLNVCALLETHVKESRMGKIYEFVYRNWQWISNSMESTRGCIIIVGWNVVDVDVMYIHCNRQDLLCLIEVLNTKHKFFCSFIYVDNHGRERKDLWKPLNVYKGIVNNFPWVLRGEGNVSLNVYDHSSGGSCKTNDKKDFQDYVEELEIKDLNCTGLHYTWIQRVKAWKEKLENIQAKVDVEPSNFSNEEVEDMIRPVTEEEIKRAMWDIDDNKAPGPNGYTSEFYKKA